VSRDPLFSSLGLECLRSRLGLEGFRSRSRALSLETLHELFIFWFCNLADGKLQKKFHS